MTLLLLESLGLPSTSGIIVPGAPGIYPGSGLYPSGVLSLLLPGPGTYPRGITYPGVIPPQPPPLVLTAALSPASVAFPLTVVQAAPTTGAASLTTAAVTLPQPTGTGNTLVACITTNGNTTNPAVSGLTLGGSADNWQAAFTDPAASPFGAAIWYDPNCAGGQTSVVVNCTGGAGANPKIYLAVYEVSGVLAFDQSAHGDVASGATTWSSGASGTTTQANEIFFGVCMPTITAVPTVTGVGTWTTQSLSSSAFGQVSGYQIVSSTGTATFSGTIPSGGYTAVVATFLPLSSATLSAVDAPSAVLTATDQRTGGPR